MSASYQADRQRSVGPITERYIVSLKAIAADYRIVMRQKERNVVEADRDCLIEALERHEDVIKAERGTVTTSVNFQTESEGLDSEILQIITDNNGEHIDKLSQKTQQDWCVLVR